MAHDANEEFAAAVRNEIMASDPDRGETGQTEKDPDDIGASDWPI